MTRISKSVMPSSAMASPVRCTVSAMTASSLYAGSTALIEGWGTSAASTHVVDDDVIGAGHDRKALVSPPAEPGLRVDRAGILDPIVDLHVADVVLAQQCEHRTR